MWWRTSNSSPLLIYRPREDERLSWPGWLTYSGRLTHISGHPLATGRAHDGERTLARDWRSTAEPRVPTIVTVWFLVHIDDTPSAEIPSDHNLFLSRSRLLWHAVHWNIRSLLNLFQYINKNVYVWMFHIKFRLQVPMIRLSAIVWITSPVSYPTRLTEIWNSQLYVVFKNIVNKLHRSVMPVHLSWCHQ